jgi:tetratricopeptide (TPR) repeat protein
MRLPRPNPAVFFLVAALLGPATGFAQQSSSNQQPAAQAPDDNSFPEAVSKQAAREAADKKKAEDKAEDKQDDTAPAPRNPAAPAKDDNAFPEDASRKAAEDARAASSSSSGVSSSSDYDNRVNGGRGAVRPDVAMPHVDGKDPVKEDLNVGSLYLETGNYAGAYLRYKEATTLAPANTDAMFGLAEAARHLKKFDEAMTNYQLFLQVVDSGPKAKDARKAVASLEKISK